jgi:hypothetical protein
MRDESTPSLSRRAALGLLGIGAGTLALGGCAGRGRTPTNAAPRDAAPALDLREAFPRVALDARARVVEIRGEVPIPVGHPQYPRIFLEVICCTPDSKPHEALCASPARASHVHAALLAIGLTPGTPGVWTLPEGARSPVPTDPTGPGLDVTLVWRDDAGTDIEKHPGELVRSVRTGRTLLETMREQDASAQGAGGPRPGWVFAGSRMVPRRGAGATGEVYLADVEGVHVGLTNFGHEVVQFRDMVSPDSTVREPEWIADAALCPPERTPIAVRLRAV